LELHPALNLQFLLFDCKNGANYTPVLPADGSIVLPICDWFCLEASKAPKK
jgi:hypothetical protein